MIPFFRIIALYLFALQCLSIVSSIYAQQQVNSTLLGSLAFEEGQDIIVVENYAYVSNLSGIIIISISDYSSPIQIGFIETPGNCTSMDANEDYLFVADGDQGIRVYDIAIPEHPELKTIIDDSMTVVDIDIENNYLSIVSGSGWSSFSLVDISDIENPIKSRTSKKP